MITQEQLKDIPTIKLVESHHRLERKLRTCPNLRSITYALDWIEAELFRRAARAADELGVIRNWIINPPHK